MKVIFIILIFFSYPAMAEEILAQKSKLHLKLNDHCSVETRYLQIKKNEKLGYRSTQILLVIYCDHDPYQQYPYISDVIPFGIEVDLIKKDLDKDGNNEILLIYGQGTKETKVNVYSFDYKDPSIFAFKKIKGEQIRGGWEGAQYLDKKTHIGIVMTNFDQAYCGDKSKAKNKTHYRLQGGKVIQTLVEKNCLKS